MSQTPNAVPLRVMESGRASSPPLVVLHGFLGSCRNWRSVARQLEDRWHVLLADLRNHGRSPHTDTMTFDDSVADLERLFVDHHLERATVMGHSLGGKVAMRFACVHPQRVETLFVLDIAPRRYEPETEYVDAMLELDLGIMDRRSDADDALSDLIDDDDTRAFLLTNLRRNADDEFHWLPNLEVLREQRSQIAAAGLDESHRFDGRTVWIVGGESGYVGNGDEELMRRHFPHLEVHVLDGIGHNVHVEGGERFLELVS